MPKLSSLVNSQSDLPSTISSGTLAGSTQSIYMTLLP